MNVYALLLGAVALSVGLLFLRFLLNDVYIKVGEAALSKQPDALRLSPVGIPVWSSPEKMEKLCGPLLLLGFKDCGTWSAPEAPGVKIRFLLKEDEDVAAFVYDYPKVGVWLELSTRYEDGTTTALSNRSGSGLEDPPFFRLSRADPATPAGELHRRHVAARAPAGIKRVTRDTVVPEYELAFAKIMVWRKHRGLTADEVARVAAKMAADRRAAKG